MITWEAAGSSGGGSFVGFLPIVGIGIVFFLFVQRGSRRRRMAVADVQEALLPGAEVMTTAGLFATVVRVGEDDVDLQVSPGVVCRYARGAVARVIGPDDEPPTGPPEEPGHPPD